MADNAGALVSADILYGEQDPVPVFLAIIEGDGEGGVPIISNISPASGSSIVADQPVSFDVTEADGIAFVFVYVQEGATAEPCLVYDGSAFVGRFIEDSTVTVIGSTGFSFSLVPTGGWASARVEITVKAVGSGGGVLV